MAKKHKVIERLPWLPNKSCYIKLKSFWDLEWYPYTSEGFRFVAFVVLEIPGGGVLFDPSPLVLGVGTKTHGARRVKTGIMYSYVR